MSGYELAQRFEASVGSTWSAGHSQIYPELNRLADEGLVEAGEPGPRGRKTYAITDEGRDTVRAWLADTDPDRTVRDEAALRTFFLWLMEPDDARAHVEGELAAAQETLEALRGTAAARRPATPAERSSGSPWRRGCAGPRRGPSGRAGPCNAWTIHQRETAWSPSSVSHMSSSFEHEGHRLAYTVYGEGPRTTVLLHGLLLSQKMHRPLARALAREGNRVVTLDLLGHGRSDRPRDMAAYSMPFFGEQVIALLDHLEVDEAVVAGTSLGANTTLEAAAAAPRARARDGRRDAGPRQRAAGLRDRLHPADVRADLRRAGDEGRLVGDPQGPDRPRLGRRHPARHRPPAARARRPPCCRGSSSAASRRTARSGARSPRRRWSSATTATPSTPSATPTRSSTELPNARLLRADSLLELRLSPERLTGEIAGFLDECWRPRRKAGARRAAGVA